MFVIVPEKLMIMQIRLILKEPKGMTLVKL